MENDIREKLIVEMRSVFDRDQKRIDHAMAVLGFAEKLQKLVGGGKLVVIAAGILHDIGIHEAERKYNSPAGNYQEIEGPPIARKILEKYDIDKKRTEHVCEIIANHHSGRDIDTLEFRILWDADWLVNLEEVAGESDEEKLAKMIDKTFKTEHGRRMAIEKYMKK